MKMLPALLIALAGVALSTGPAAQTPHTYDHSFAG